MPAGPSDAQREAAAHRGGPLSIVGGPGTGKTSTLVARAVSLVAGGERPERLLALALTPATADSLRRALEGAIEPPREELAVHTLRSLSVALLREGALEAGVDPFFVPVSAADRIAMLSERIGELTVRRHDFRGNPALLVRSFVVRIDALKAQLVGSDGFGAWADGLPDDDDEQRATAAREREFAEVWRVHDRMLAERGVLDGGDVVARTLALLRDEPQARRRAGRRWGHLLVDDWQEYDHAALQLVALLEAAGLELTAAADPSQAIARRGGVATRNADALGARATVVRLERSARCPAPVAAAVGAVLAPNPEGAPPLQTERPGEVAFWRCRNDRAQAQSVAAEVERLITREGVAPERIGVLVRSLRSEGEAVAVALEERSVPFRLVGAATLFGRAEVRDVLAWLRLLADPTDAGAVVRALSRPPIELRSIDLARVTQIARRRKLDMVAALVAATESPQIPPEARDRVLRFLKLYRSSAAALDTTRPDLFVHGLIDRLGLRRQQLYAAQADVVARLRNLARFGELAAAFAQREPHGTPRDFARYVAAVAEAGAGEEEAAAEREEEAVRVLSLQGARGLEFDTVLVVGLTAARVPGARRRAAEPLDPALLGEELPPETRATHVERERRLLALALSRTRERLVLAYPAESTNGAQQAPSPFAEEARAALDAAWDDREEELFGPAESLHSTYRMMREELLETVQRLGGRLGELRFDTELGHLARRRALPRAGEARCADRPCRRRRPAHARGRTARRQRAARWAPCRPSSARCSRRSMLDDWLLDAERDGRRRAQVVAARDEPSLEAFLPRRGDGLVLSASDIETYRACPLRYKFARVFRIPTEPTLNQRFGILIHQVLERYPRGRRHAAIVAR